MLFRLVFTACLTVADAACSCEPYKSLEEAFCKSDYVLIAKVKTINFEYGKTNATDSGTWSYKIWHMNTWKGPILSSSLLTTPNSEDACGVPGLSKEVDYFLTGKNRKDGEIFFTSCDYLMPSYDLTPEEHDHLLQLEWYPEKCKEIYPESSGQGNDQKPTGGDGEKPVEGDDGKGVKENGDEPPQENEEKTEDDHAGQPIEGDDEKGVKENGDEPSQENEEKTENDNAGQPEKGDDEKGVEENGDEPPQENEEKTEKDSDDQTED